jgi:hypothetical protein
MRGAQKIQEILANWLKSAKWHVQSIIVSGRELIFKNRFCNTLDGATDQDVAVFAEQLEELFPHRPEVLDPMQMARKLPRQEHRLFALRRAVECVINNLLMRSLSREEKYEHRAGQ